MKWIKAKLFNSNNVIYIQVSNIISMGAVYRYIRIVCKSEEIYDVHKDYTIMSELAVLEEIQNA